MTKSKKNKYGNFFLLILFLVIPSIALAQSGKPIKIGAPIPGCKCQNSTTVPADYCTLPEYVVCVYSFVTWVAGLLAVMMIIYGGFKYISSSGNPEALQEAKEIVIGAIVGLVILLLGYLILSTIKPGMVG